MPVHGPDSASVVAAGCIGIKGHVVERGLEPSQQRVKLSQRGAVTAAQDELS